MSDVTDRSMEHFGLSSRGAANVEAIWPRISKAVADREQKEEVPRIDMGTSENWLIRRELIAHYKEAVQAGLSDQVGPPYSNLTLASIPRSRLSTL